MRPKIGTSKRKRTRRLQPPKRKRGRLLLRIDIPINRGGWKIGKFPDGRYWIVHYSIQSGYLSRIEYFRWKRIVSLLKVKP